MSFSSAIRLAVLRSRAEVGDVSPLCVGEGRFEIPNTSWQRLLRISVVPMSNDIDSSGSAIIFLPLFSMARTCSFVARCCQCRTHQNESLSMFALTGRLIPGIIN